MLEKIKKFALSETKVKNIDVICIALSCISLAFSVFDLIYKKPNKENSEE